MGNNKKVAKGGGEGKSGILNRDFVFFHETKQQPEHFEEGVCVHCIWMRHLGMTGGVLFIQLYLRGDIVRVNLGHARGECYIKKKEDAKKLEDIFQHFIEGQLQGTQR